MLDFSPSSPASDNAAPASNVAFVYNPTNFRSNSPDLFPVSPLAFNAAVSVCFTTPTRYPALTNRRTYTFNRTTGTLAVR